MAGLERFTEVLHDVHAKPRSKLDLAVAEVAEQQRGLITRAQLEEVGVGRGGIAHRVAEGRLHRVHRGVYLVGHRVPAPLVLEMAALLASGVGAVLSHRSAAKVWQMPVPAIRAVEVSLIGRDIPSRPGIRLYRLESLDSGDRRSHAGLPLTSPARTLLDLGAVLTPRSLEHAVAEARVRRLVSPRELQSVLARAPRRHGACAVRSLLHREAAPALTRSEAEELLLTLVRSTGLPSPETNVRLGAYEVDFLWRMQRLVVEVDGYAFHSSPAAFERDRQRDADLHDPGFRVRRVTWRQLTEDPAGIARKLRRALHASPQPSGAVGDSPP